MYQLFIVDHLQKKGNQIFLPDVPELLFQLRNVLRAKLGDTLFVQPESWVVRYGVTLTHRTDTQLEGEIVKEEERDIEGLLNICMLIAMPNKREKAELIVQKLSEIGIDQLLFRPAERSILKRESFQKKEERLIKIAKEAVEQSRWRRVPKIARCEKICEVCEGKTPIVFDLPPVVDSPAKGRGHVVPEGVANQQLLWIIWPEGGLTPRDYENFSAAPVRGLGETVLRMETAAIVGAWLLKHS